MRSTTEADGPRRRRSLAGVLTAWYAGSAFALVLLATGLLYWALAASLDQEDDEFLVDQVRILRTILREPPSTIESLREEVQVESAARRNARVLLRVLDAGGGTRLETPGMSAVLAPTAFPEPVGAAHEPAAGAVVRGVDGREFRAVAARATIGPPGAGACVVQVAVDRTRDEDLLAGFRRTLVAILAAAIVLAAAAGYGLARRGLRPVGAIARAARRIGSSTLDRRIDARGLPAELADLAGTFNDMLARLEEAFGRLSQFSADLAHELRTPVGNLRGEVEVALGKARTPDEYREALGSALEECERLARIIDGLLFLARAEQPSPALDRSRLDLGVELRAVREFFAAAAEERGVALQVDAPAPVPADLDRTLLHRAVTNLLDNALAYTPQGGTVTLSARAAGREVVLEVADGGCGIPPEHLPHVFERFYRVNRSRTSGSGGTGLGLAIVRSIAVLHGGSAAVASPPGGGTRVTLRFPGAPLQPADAAGADGLGPGPASR